MHDKQISFVGGGNMAGSIIGGLVKQGYPVDRLCVSDPNEGTLAELKQSYGINTNIDNRKMVSDADLIVLAVKPHLVKSVLQDINDTINPSAAILSVAAGVSVEQIQDALSTPTPIIRCMPNTPALIGFGASALYANASVSSAQKEMAAFIFNAVGMMQWLEKESQIDAITALSGSGPAYFFLFMEYLTQAGVRLGLTAELAERFTIQTALGAAKMVQQSAESVATLRQRVTSPNGTTECGVRTLMDADLSEIIDNALQAAARRSAEISNELK